MAAGNRATMEANVEGKHPKVVLVQNETVLECSQSLTSGEWLASAPRGAYTTGRTVNRDAVFEFEFHVQRLATSIKLMLENDHVETPAHLLPLLDVETLRPLVLASLCTAVREFTAPGEIKLTVLITWDDEKYDILTHLVSLPPLPMSPVKVMVKGCPRTNAAAKDSDWVRERKSLEDEKPADVNEIVLMEKDGHLFEGMSSNFFAISKDGSLITAGQGILEGTVRELILQVCKREGIPVILEAPLLSEVDNWEGAMVSSTSRLGLPIDEFTYPAEEGMKTIQFDNAKVTSHIAKLVQQSIEEASTKVF